MKPKILTTLSLTLIILSTMNAQTQPQVEVKVKKMDEIHLVCYAFTGPYQQSFNDFPKLMGYIQSKKLPMGPYSLGIYYDDPQQVPADQLKSEVGFMVTKKADVETPYKYKKLEGVKAVTAKYTSMEGIMPAYQAIAAYVAENKLKTAPYSVEIYYSYDETNVDAEIFMPLAEE
jgi:effector-binding domain-containing protein